MSNSIPTIVCALRAPAPAPLAPAKPEEYYPSQPIGKDAANTGKDVTEGLKDVALLEKLEDIAPRWNLRRRRQRIVERPHPKFLLNLTKNEINEDLYSTGRLLRNHPRRRPVPVQKMFNRLVPEALLDGVTLETYPLAPKKQ